MGKHSRFFSWFFIASALLAASPSGVASEDAPRYPPDSPLVWPGTVDRRSAHVDRSGLAHGPWKSAVAFAGLPRPVQKGDVVTVIPVRPGLPSVDVTVTSVKAQDKTDLTETMWLTSAETTLKAFLDAEPDPGRAEEHPFEAIVIYPAQPQARLVPKQAVSKDLPKGRGVSLRTLWAAVDLDGDARPDVEIFRFCCDRPKVASRRTDRSPCQFDCEQILLRTREQKWKLVRDASDF